MSELLETLWTDAAGEAIIHGCTKPWPNDIKWVRADLPPTLSAAMELPEVKAMKAALELARNRLQRLAIEFPTESEGRYEVNEWAEEATAALAAIKETKT